jgi:hypothetical protein
MTLENRETSEAVRRFWAAFEAWDNDLPFAPDDDPDRTMECDSDFLVYMAEQAAIAMPGVPDAE